MYFSARFQCAYCTCTCTYNVLGIFPRPVMICSCHPRSRGQAAPGSDELLAKVEALQQQLEGARRELQGARDRKASLERECVIYQSQLEVCEA